MEESTQLVGIVSQSIAPRKRGRPKRSEVLSTAMTLPNADVDEVNLTWNVGQAVGMRADNPGLVIKTLRRSQRKGQQLST